jgi:hypothetical protein
MMRPFGAFAVLTGSQWLAPNRQDPALHVRPAGHGLAQLPQAAMVVVFVSQPLATSPSQSAYGAMQLATAHVPLAQVAFALGGSQGMPHAPQFWSVSRGPQPPLPPPPLLVEEAAVAVPAPVVDDTAMPELATDDAVMPPPPELVAGAPPDPELDDAGEAALDDAACDALLAPPLPSRW